MKYMIHEQMPVADKYSSPPDCLYGLWYYPGINRFADEDDNILHDFSHLFDTWVLDEWKRTRDYGMMFDKNGDLCELYYQTPVDERDFIGRIRRFREGVRQW